MSPLQRTHAYLRERGMLVAKTEHYNWKAKVRQDLFGFIDTIALDPTAWDCPLALQVTDGAHHAEHVKKILGKGKELETIMRHFRVELWSWSLRKEGRRKLWTLRRERFKWTLGGVVNIESKDPLNL